MLEIMKENINRENLLAIANYYWRFWFYTDTPMGYCR
jgi:hypothetical protein